MTSLITIGEPLQWVLGNLDEKERGAVAQTCTYFHNKAFSKASYQNSSFPKLLSILQTAPKTLLEKLIKSKKAFSFIDHEIQNDHDRLHILPRWGWKHVCVSKDGKELYNKTLAKSFYQHNRGLGFSSKYYFYIKFPINITPNLLLLQKKDGIVKDVVLPPIFNGAGHIFSLYCFKVISNSTLVAVFVNKLLTISIIYNFESNTIEHSYTLYFPAYPIKLRNYLYLLSNAHPAVILDVDQQLKPVECDISNFEKRFTGKLSKIRKNKLFDLSEKNKIVCYSNDPKGNIVKDWEQNIDRVDDNNEDVLIRINPPFVAINSISAFVTGVYSEQKMTVLDATDHGKIIWSKHIKQNSKTAFTSIPHFFQRHVLSYIDEMAEEKFRIKLIYFDPKSKKPKKLPTIKLKGLDRGFFSLKIQWDVGIDLCIKKDAIFLSRRVYKFDSNVKELKLEKYERAAIQPKQQPIITSNRKINKLQKLCRFLRNLVWKIKALAKKIFCCKK